MEKKELTLGKYLKQLRLEAGLSPSQARKKLRLKSNQAIYGLETEQWIPPLLLIKKMSKLYVIPNKDIRIAVARFKISRIKKQYGLK